MPSNVLEYTLKIKDEATKTLEKFGKDVDSISSKSFLGVGAVMTGIGVASALVAKDMINTAGKFEQADIAFQTLTGSVETGNKLFEQLKDFAKVTPFNLTNLQESTKRLLAMGGGADTVIEDLRMLGDVASGVGMEKMPQLITAFGQIRAKGKLTGEELRQLREAGFNLADALGITNQKLEEMVSNRDLTFADVRKGFALATAEGGLFYKMMEKQSKTALGQWSNLEDAIDQTKATIGNALLPSFKSLLEAVIPVINKFAIWASENPKLIQLIFALGGAFLVVGGALVVIGTVLGGLVLAFGTAGALMAGTIGLVVVAVIGLVASFFIWKDEILGFFNTVWQAIVTFVTNFATSFVEGFNNVMESIRTFFTNLITAFMEYFTLTYEQNKVWIDLIISVFMFLFDSIKWIWESIFTVIQYVVGLIWTSIQIAWAKILEFTIPIFNQIKEFLSSVWNFILSSVIKPTIEAVKSAVKAGFELVKQNIITPVTEAYKFLSDKFDAMYNKVVEIKDKIVNKFKDLAEGITNALKSIKFPHLSIGEGSTTVVGKEIKYPKLNVDWYEKGGWVGNTGLAMVHEGEFVLSKDMLHGNKQVPSSVMTTNNNSPIQVNAVINTPIDVFELGNILGTQLAFAGR